MIKFLKFSLFSFLLSLCLTACLDDDTPIGPTVDPPMISTCEAYVVIQGNQWGGVTGSIDKLYLSEGTVASNFFFTTNQQALGDTPQSAIRYGQKIYVPVFGSNVLWVLDAHTLQIKAQIQCTAPEAVCGAGNYVYVARNDGKVMRVDTLSLKADSKEISVGPNPAGVVAANGKVYVSISDGYNSAENYKNGKKLAVIDPLNFEKTSDIAVGLNPGRITADSKGNLYVVCNGNYADIAPKVQRVSIDGKVSDYCEGQFTTMHNDELYVMNVTADYVNNSSTMTLKRYNTLTAQAEEVVLDAEHTPGMPNTIDIHPDTQGIYICSDKGPMDYDKTGFVYEYLPDGSFVQRYDVGIHPFGLVFK